MVFAVESRSPARWIVSSPCRAPICVVAFTRREGRDGRDGGPGAGHPADRVGGGPAEALGLDSLGDLTGGCDRARDVERSPCVLRRMAGRPGHRDARRSAATAAESTLDGWEVTARCCATALGDARDRSPLCWSARIVLPVILLVFLARRLGLHFRPALEVISPVPLVAAVALGGLGGVGPGAAVACGDEGPGSAAANAARRSWSAIAPVRSTRSCPVVSPATLYGPGGSALVPPWLASGRSCGAGRAFRRIVSACWGWRPWSSAPVGPGHGCLCVGAVAGLVGRPAGSAPTQPARRQVAVWSWSVLAVVALVGIAAVAAAAVGASMRLGFAGAGLACWRAWRAS